MKNMTSLMKVEIILMKRQAVYYLLSIGLPSVLPYLFWYDVRVRYSRNCSSSLSFAMTLFSIMSSAFSIPSTLESDKTNNWQKLIQHSPVSMVEYYVSKLFSTLLTFLVINYSCLFSWSFVRGVTLPWLDWMVIGAILLIGSVVFISMGSW